MPRPKQRTSALKRHVLDCALSVLTSKGPQAFTTRCVATAAGTSLAAMYELFGDKGGLVRDIFAESFRRLAVELEELQPTGDARADLLAVGACFRDFARANPVLAQVMFSRPFSEFEPGPADAAAAATVRGVVVRRVQDAIDAGLIGGDPVDAAHVLVALVQGLVAQETAGWLGSSRASADRRWTLAVEAMVDGLAPAPVVGRARVGGRR